MKWFISLFLIFLVSCSTQTKQTNPSVEKPKQTKPIHYETNDNLNNVYTLEKSNPMTDHIRFSNKKISNPNPNIPPLKETNIKGIYVGALAFNSQESKEVIQFIKKNDLNAVVIDIKDDNGFLTYDSKNRLALEIDAVKNQTKDIQSLLHVLKKEEIYTIARIVTFKDPLLAKHHDEWSIKKKNGEIWKDRNGTQWVDPYIQIAWEYNVSIAKEVASLGFDEIQFDYVRFPDNAIKMDKEVIYSNPKDWSKSENISAFLRYASMELKELNRRISADIFGLVTTANNDMGIGQQWEDLTTSVDILSPMMYPSHYSDGSYGIQHPENNPHLTIENGLKDAIKRNEDLMKKGEKVATIRPWYQDFDYKGKYGLSEVQLQIKAGKELGVQQYLLWNQSHKYSTK